MVAVLSRMGGFRDCAILDDPIEKDHAMSLSVGRMFKILSFWCFYVVLVVSLGCSNEVTGKAKAEDPRKKLVVPVFVGIAAEKSVPVDVRAIGNVQASARVAIKAQVTGELTGVHFNEGQFVKKGDLLFTIDPRPFDARLKQIEANLARSRVQLQNARKQVERYGSVVKKGYVAEDQYDQVVSNSAVLDATVRADEAAVEQARLELKYTSIRSPINGSTGDLKLHAGNVIKANDNDQPMVTINQISPIHVTFSVPEQNLPEIKQHMAMGSLDVTAVVPGDAGGPVKGVLSFMDNQVDSATGTIQLKGTFPNDDRRLWPGQYVNVVLTLSTQRGVVVVPSQAVQTGQQGSYVYVVRPDMTVDYRIVELGRNIDQEVVVKNGLSFGEKVVTEGQLRLAPGAQVKIADGGAGAAEEVKP
jgi:membrane fusion protein, multidrug efflux system